MMILSESLTPTLFAALLYIDPNSGGILLQYLLPMFVAIGAGWVMLKDKISSKIAQFLQPPKRSREE